MSTATWSTKAKQYLELVRFSHTLFALPFALMALFLALPGEWPSPRTTAWILVCMVGARTAAMAYNRLVDRDVDAENPRTRNRHLPAGFVGVTEVVLLVVGASAVFVVGAAALNPLAFALSPVVLVVLLGYSHLKRFTALCHLGLGVALGLAPLGVWIAVRGAIDASAWVPAMLGLAVLCWVSGFDILYACQDTEFDRGAGLHSIPARFGVPRALWIARLSHGAMLLALVGLGLLAQLGIVYAIGVALTAALLAYEHRLVRADDLSRIDVAFFTVNGCISLLLCAFTIAEQFA
ncbi:MAG: UbiA family prenyltransferase [Planctomycetes bacterium]|nr:UbiA family prenyltransferase [Planctomycetota bacterium]MCC7170183.1 UbiA family prenyltransferase [Planctomycetota bacterium]